MTALVALTGLSLLFSMAALLGLVVVHHSAQDAYDASTCQGCRLLGAELGRQAKALSRVWREVEAVGGREPDMSGTAVRREEVGAEH